jgi:NAD(P)-dependent dehydrogenase (short-subunit alcohol dehydrogenase family)
VSERFAGKVALVTGAGSGIGQATASRLGAEGAVVACVDLVETAAEKTAAGISEAGGIARSYQCDVRDAGSVAGVVAAAVGDLGRVSVVCNIAGIGSFAHSHELAVADWDRIIAVNLTGTFLVAQACLPHLLDGGGVIVNTASTAGLMGQPYSAAYCASKGGVVMLTKALASEYIKQGVRVNAIAPGGVDTPILNSFGPPEDADYKLLYKIMTPMGYATPDELASLFAYVASDEARYMTGSIVTMDGGITT